MGTQGWLSSATTLVRFEDVRVPTSNIIGREGQGFKAIMLNFNQERFASIVISARMARVCFEDAAAYAHKRTTFGKPLFANGVIRQKLGNMVRAIEMLQNTVD